MSFSIAFVKQPPGYPPEEGFKWGKIVMGDFGEHFEASLSFWSVSDYQAHWKNALERIVAGADKSCLITSMYDPKYANWILWWPLFRAGSTVYVHNQMLLIKEFHIDLDPQNPYIHVRDRETADENGRKISEWSTSVEAIADFLANPPPAILPAGQGILRIPERLRRGTSFARRLAGKKGWPRR